MRTAATIAGVVALAFGASGCGDDAPKKADVVARGNAICASALRALRAVPSPATGPDGGPALDTLGPYLVRVEKIVAREIADLQKLPRPAQDRAVLERFLAAAKRSGKAYAALAAAAQRRDGAGVLRAEAALRASPAKGLARRYGLTGCTGGGTAA